MKPGEEERIENAWAALDLASTRDSFPHYARDALDVVRQEYRRAVAEEKRLRSALIDVQAAVKDVDPGW